MVATRVAGTRDLIEDGRTGFLTMPGDSEGIAARALDVLEGTLVRAPLAQAVISKLAESHGHETALRRHLELYERLLAS